MEKQLEQYNLLMEKEEKSDSFVGSLEAFDVTELCYKWRLSWKKSGI